MADEDKRVSIRLTAEDVNRIRELALGDETLSQTVRRVLREAHEKGAPKPTKKKTRQ
jgi:hypothetical protein